MTSRLEGEDPAAAMNMNTKRWPDILARRRFDNAALLMRHRRAAVQTPLDEMPEMSQRQIPHRSMCLPCTVAAAADLVQTAGPNGAVGSGRGDLTLR